MTEIIFIRASAPQRDVDLMIADAAGRIDAPTRTLFGDETMAHVMQQAGAFPAWGRRSGTAGTGKCRRGSASTLSASAGCW